MTLHSIIGFMNSGKTLIMTLWLYQEYKKGRVIYSNYPLTFPHFRVNKDYIIMLGREQPDLKNITFGLDEFWIWFDSRKSGGNTEATNFLLQSSKQDTNIYMTAQDNSQNDLRVRKNQHLITVCKRKILEKRQLIDIDDLKRILPLSMQPFLYINFRTYTYKIIGMTKMLILKFKGNIKAQPLFSLYDTHNKIKNE